MGFKHFYSPSTCCYCNTEIAKPGLCRRCQSGLTQLSNERRCRRCFSLKKLNSECFFCNSRIVFFDSCESLYKLDKVGQSILNKLKFQNERFISDLFIDEVVEKITSFGKFQQIGWISSGKLAYRSRPYQPVADVAKAVGEKLKIPVSADLTKVKNRKQSGADYQSRFFDLPQSLRLTESPKQISYYVLLDDVVTTGATVNESARLLKRSGVKEVHVISLFQRERE